jgi:hypothetical protein
MARGGDAGAGAKLLEMLPLGPARGGAARGRRLELVLDPGAEEGIESACPSAWTSRSM